MLEDDPMMTALSGDPRTPRLPRDPRTRPPQTFDLSGYGLPISSFTQQQRQPNAGGSAVRRAGAGDPRERPGWSMSFNPMDRFPALPSGDGRPPIFQTALDAYSGMTDLVGALRGLSFDDMKSGGIQTALNDWREGNPMFDGGASVLSVPSLNDRTPRKQRPGVPSAAPALAPAPIPAPAIPAGPINRIGSSYGVQGAFNPGGQFSLPRY